MTRGAAGSGGRWALVAGWAALMAACGGSGGGGGDAPAPAPAPPPAAAPAPADPAIARIEPYVCGSSTLAVATKSAPAATATATPRVVALGALATPKLQAEQPGLPRQIGLGRPVAATRDPAALAQQLDWRATPQGGLVAALAFRSEGATAVRLGVLVDQLPPQAVLRVYGPGGAGLQEVPATEVLDTLARNAQAGDGSPAGRTHWMPAVDGATATLEVELPAGVPAAQVQLAVPMLSHLYASAARLEDAQPKIGESASCNVDATCSPTYAEDAKSVARIEFVDQGTTYLCNGTLLADSPATGTPWFLGANHCVSNQTAASTITSYWFYRSAACNSGTLNPDVRVRTGGATLLYASAATDTSFMRLNAAPPAGAVCQGSLLGAPALGSGMTALHNPRGDLLKISQGTLGAFANCTGNSCSRNTSGGNYLALQWSSGTTEGGSSGSAALATVGSRRYVVGVLFAGTASCANPNGFDYYGRFDTAYNAALRQWLTPGR